NDLHARCQLTQFYFHNTDRTVFLRVHPLQAHGDPVNRYTLKEAVRTGRPSSGVELGNYGFLTLRVVRPWFVDGRITGYLELGQEMGHIPAQLHEILGSEFLITLDKQLIDRPEWEARLRTTGSRGNWDEVAGSLIVDRTLTSIPGPIVDVLSQQHTRHVRITRKVSADGACFAVGIVPIHDVTGYLVGDLVVVDDVTANEASLRRLVLALTVICLVIGAGLCTLCYSLSGSVQRQLEASHARALEESRSREAAQTEHLDQIEREREALRQSRQALKERVAELATARESALNMMEDADRARRSAEQSEAALRDYARALESANTELEELHHVAQVASRAKSDFLANMSHEIRTPMTAILGFAENLRAADLSEPEKRHAIDTISRNGEHLLQLINDILDLSKIEAGKLHVERIACSPLQIIADVRLMMQVRAGAKGLLFDVEYTGVIPETIHTDPMRLRQILVNLVGNAVKFTSMGGVRLAVRLAEDPCEPSIQFDVIDSGIGMTREQVDRLFRPFTQADETTTRRFGGTGLGLVISRRLANLLDGEITVQSEPGEGSVFSVRVPTGSLAGATMIDHPEDAAVVELPVESATPVRLEGRILLAEDGLDNQRLISFILKKAGAEVEVVENGLLACEKALAALQADQPFDAILMDMQMPVLDGYAATQRLREEGYRGPVIALTAHAMRGDREKCLRSGCDDYLSKPIDRANLLATVSRLTQVREGAPLARAAD
ncbi:MAG: ATP-binding protein, partial [Pirellulales bacterium]